jgi:hypothetical protein
VKFGLYVSTRDVFGMGTLLCTQLDLMFRARFGCIGRMMEAGRGGQGAQGRGGAKLFRGHLH